ncbi:MAG: AbrB family transcriptional regulator [Rhodoferax sp.]|nr:AbrB family transcriptional regulator [Rhodoferax sp.]
MTTTAKVFMNGRSQAIRLPAKMRLQAKEVRIEQIGNGFWLQPQTTVSNDLGKWLQDFYACTDVLPQDYLKDRQDAPPQERDWT